MRPWTDLRLMSGVAVHIRLQWGHGLAAVDGVRGAAIASRVA